MVILNLPLELLIICYININNKDMEEKDVFEFFEGVEHHRGIVIAILESYDHGSDWYVEYLCYSQNKLFILAEEGIRLFDEYSFDILDESVTYKVKGILVDYASIPELDNIIQESYSSNNITKITSD